MYYNYNIGSENVITKAVSALYNVFNDGASDDRAVKCYVSSHYNRNGRRRLIVLEATANNNQCECVKNNLIFYLMGKYVHSNMEISTLKQPYLLYISYKVENTSYWLWTCKEFHLVSTLLCVCRHLVATSS